VRAAADPRRYASVEFMENSLKIEPALEVFADIVQRYCSWAESPSGEPHDEMLAARKLLAELHLAALSLPDLGPGEDTEDELTADDWKIVCSRFQKLPVGGYWDVFDPLKEEAPVFNSLWDDLSDIYRDLKEGLLLYRNGRIVEAAWEWRFNFEIHWGAHLTGAQRAIHAYFS
jgi:hypothetical protein